MRNQSTKSQNRPGIEPAVPQEVWECKPADCVLTAATAEALDKLLCQRQAVAPLAGLQDTVHGHP